MAPKTWWVGRRLYTATHVLNKDVTRGNSEEIVPKGTKVYLEASKKVKEYWKVLVTCPIKSKSSNLYIFETDWNNLDKL